MDKCHNKAYTLKCLLLQFIRIRYISDFFSNLTSGKMNAVFIYLFPHIIPEAMSRVQAITDYSGPDCRYLNFKAGEEITVYSKLSRENENLWTGSVSTSI